MKAKFSILQIVLTVLTTALLLAGCQDQESMAVAENTSPEAPAIPVSVVAADVLASRSAGERRRWRRSAR